MGLSSWRWNRGAVLAQGRIPENEHRGAPPHRGGCGWSWRGGASWAPL